MCLNASFIMFFRIIVPNLTLFRTYKVQNLHRLSTRFLFFKVNGCALKVGGRFLLRSDRTGFPLHFREIHTHVYSFPFATSANKAYLCNRKNK